MTAKKAKEILLEKIRRQKDNNNMTRNTLPAERGGKCRHYHRKGHIMEDCWLLHPEKKKKQKKTQISGTKKDHGY